MERRAFLRSVATAGVATGLAGRAGATDGEGNPGPVDGTGPYRPKVTELRYPLAGVPAIVETGDRLRVELAPDADVADPVAELVASVGAGEPIELDRLAVVGRRESAIWNGDEGEQDRLLVVEYAVPETDRRFSPGLYDLRVRWDGCTDRQPRAVRVYESIPDEPEVVAIADPQLGDPRYVATGATEARNEQSVEPVVDHTLKGTGTPTERWGATRRAVAEVNAVDPDFAVVAGDLTFGQDVPGKYYLEYEDAWDALNQLRVPSFCTLGNHDGYVQGGVDGKALYRRTFGPPSYSVDVGDLHLVAVDTYDWSYLDRLGAGVAVSTYGGQVRDRQLDWLREDLQRWRADNDEGTVLAVGHHDPSWQPDPVNRLYDETDGRPVLEQVGRGSRYVDTGQLWTGENLFALRRLLDDHDVTAYVSGHSHRDRLARTVPGGAGPADVAETHSPRTASPGYHHVAYGGRPAGDDEYDDVTVTVDPGSRSDDAVVDTIRNGDGTLYVGVTTTQSSTGQYWGWRPFSVAATGDGGGAHLDPGESGYPWSAEGEAALDDRAVDAAAWTADQDAVGLYSHPSYRLGVETVTDSADRVELTVTSDLAVGVAGAVRVTLADSPGLHVEGADVVWRRHAGDRQTAKLAFDVGAGSSTSVVAEPRGPERADPA